MSGVWTKRELDIVETLTRRVRLLSIPQVKQIWWPEVGTTRQVHTRLRRLIVGGLLHRVSLNAHPLLPIQKPLASWQPGHPEPHFDTTSVRARNRWTGPPIRHEVVFASRQAANLFGSSAGRLSSLTHRDHDLLLGEVYVLYRTSRSGEASLWLGEDARPKAGYRIKDPDAFLIDNYGKTLRVIESAGRYGPTQCESFHWHCVQYGLPYELW